MSTIYQSSYISSFKISTCAAYNRVWCKDKKTVNRFQNTHLSYNTRHGDRMSENIIFRRQKLIWYENIITSPFYLSGEENQICLLGDCLFIT